jgi:hypothetical protein
MTWWLGRHRVFAGRPGTRYTGGAHRVIAAPGKEARHSRPTAETPESLRQGGLPRQRPLWCESCTPWCASVCSLEAGHPDCVGVEIDGRREPVRGTRTELSEDPVASARHGPTAGAAIQHSTRPLAQQAVMHRCLSLAARERTCRPHLPRSARTSVRRRTRPMPNSAPVPLYR